jgi:hypothetical protein
MRSIKNAIILALTLGAAPAAWASNTFSDAHDDAPSANVERAISLLPYPLAPDAHDDAGVSARAFEPAGGAPSVGAYALASDAHDDAGMSARAFEPDVGLAANRDGASAKSVTAQGESTAPTHEGTCML